MNVEIVQRVGYDQPKAWRHNVAWGTLDLSGCNGWPSVSHYSEMGLGHLVLAVGSHRMDVRLSESSSYPAAIVAESSTESERR